MVSNFPIQQNEENYIFFSTGKRYYALEANFVLAVMQLTELEYPEHLPDFIAGLLKYNNQMIKIIDLRKILNLEAVTYSLNAKIIIIKIKNDIFGIITDDVGDIRRIKTSSFNAPPYKNENTFVKAIYTDKENYATLISLENIEKKINSTSIVEHNDKDACVSCLPNDIHSKEILHRRKVHYARKMSEISNVIIESQDTYIAFELEGNTCYVKILHVAGFYKYSNLKIIQVPCTPDFVQGIISIKGRYITVIDLLKFTENKKTEITPDTSIIVVEYEDYELGIITGAIGKTIDIDENAIIQNFVNTKNCLNECVIKNSMYLFLDVKKLFGDEKLYIS